jgi:hypothetical protein
MKSNGKSAEDKNANTSHLHHITDENIESEELDVFVSDDANSIPNNTNEDALIYLLICLITIYD